MFYDSRMRLTRQINANGEVTRFEYNERGDQVAITDANNNRTKFFFDKNRRLVRRERPSAIPSGPTGSIAALEVTKFFYDAAGKLIKEEKVSASGGDSHFIEYSFDGLDRLKTKTLKKGTTVQETSNFTYSPQLDNVRLPVTKKSDKKSSLLPSRR